MATSWRVWALGGARMRRAGAVPPARTEPAYDASADYRPWHVANSMMRTAVKHRLTGHAAEIGFYATLALVPATVIIGSTLGLMTNLGGSRMQARGEDSTIQVIRLLIGPKLADSVVAPFVRTQLSQPHGGLALGSVVLAWWMFSHLFTATGHGLDAAYGLSTHRRSHVQRMVALSCVVASIMVITLTMVVMVAAQDGNHAPMVIRIWGYVRWPLLWIILVAVLAGLYHFIPSSMTRWRYCLPGAVLGVLLWIGAATFFRAYVFLGAGDPTGVNANDPQVVLIGRTVGAVVGTAIFIYFSATAILVGAELNAELDRRRGARAEQRAAVPLKLAESAQVVQPVLAADEPVLAADEPVLAADRRMDG